MKYIILTLVVVSTVFLLVIFSGNTSETLLGLFLVKFAPMNWDMVNERNIVKNTIPISVIKQVNDEFCKIKADAFDRIVDHSYFVSSSSLSEELRYDRENGTLTIPCDGISDDSLELHIWYVIPEDAKYGGKYQYFVT